MQTGGPGFNYAHQQLKFTKHSGILSGSHREKTKNPLVFPPSIEAAGVNRPQQSVVLIMQLAFLEKDLSYMRKFSWYEIFTEQQANQIFVIIFLWITGPKFSRFPLISVATWLKNI